MGIKVKLVCIGKKGSVYFRRREKQYGVASACSPRSCPSTIACIRAGMFSSAAASMSSSAAILSGRCCQGVPQHTSTFHFERHVSSTR